MDKINGTASQVDGGNALLRFHSIFNGHTRGEKQFSKQGTALIRNRVGIVPAEYRSWGLRLRRKTNGLDARHCRRGALRQSCSLGKVFWSQPHLEPLFVHFRPLDSIVQCLSDRFLLQRLFVGVLEVDTEILNLSHGVDEMR